MCMRFMVSLTMEIVDSYNGFFLDYDTLFLVCGYQHPGVTYCFIHGRLDLECISLLSHNAVCLIHLILLGLWRTINCDTSHYAVFFQPPVMYFLLVPNILLSTLLTDSSSLQSSLNVRDQISNPCKIRLNYNFMYNDKTNGTLIMFH
jgi:hypothetical protein